MSTRSRRLVGLPAGRPGRKRRTMTALLRTRAGRRRSWLVAGAAVALTAGVLTWLAWPARPGVPGADRVRYYADVRACLLTGSGGVGRGQAAEVWASMESASVASHAMVSYLPVTAAGLRAATAAVAGPYLASLAQRQCAVIVTVGRPQARAATAAAARFRQIRFIEITGTRSGRTSAGKANVTQLTAAPAAAIRTTISRAISTAVSRGPAA